jgi:SAM-dependent methyltransferase
MGKESYYKKSGTFQSYIKFTNQKELLVEHLKKKLPENFNFSKYKNFVFTDIGAGDGRLTIPLINFLKDQIKLEVNCFEHSELIDEIKENCSYKNVKYFKNKIEEVEIPKSDFILMSYVLAYLTDPLETIKRIYNSLNENGVLLIVKVNVDSDDYKFKNFLRKEKETINKDKVKSWKMTVSEFLSSEGIKFNVENFESEIKLPEIENLNNETKSMVGFFYNKPFEELTKKDLDKFKEGAERFSINGVLKKKEDYIWIYKSQ